MVGVGKLFQKYMYRYNLEILIIGNDCNSTVVIKKSRLHIKYSTWYIYDST